MKIFQTEKGKVRRVAACVAVATCCLFLCACGGGAPSFFAGGGRGKRLPQRSGFSLQSEEFTLQEGCGAAVWQTLPRKLTVVIDAGHGGIDGGVSGRKTGVRESDLNLSVAKKMQSLFTAAGFSVVMTRTGQGGLYGTTASGFKLRDMKARRRIIEQAAPDLLLSVHMNYYPPGGRRGAQTFYQTESASGKAVARALQTELNALGGNSGRRSYSALPGDYFLLRGLSLPCCIIECGFLSDTEEERLLVTEEYQFLLAHAAFKGAIRYFYSCST